LEPGETGVIRQVTDSNPEMLRYLASRGLVPDAPVKVVEKAPFNGPLTVHTGDAAHALGLELASRIWVDDRAEQTE
jgi:DtxR family Mn-dependent transcriptional regulator